MLTLDRVTSGYDAVIVLRDLSLSVSGGEVLCLMGRNGAGKTTILRTIMGLVRPRSGQIRLDGRRLDTQPAHGIARAGIGYVPQGRRLFGDLSVAQNLTIGLMARDRPQRTRETVLQLFPRLRERLNQPARTLSGGEQQMLAIGRALCMEPKVLLLDEPSEGLQPSMIALIRDTIDALRRTGVATILVEQRVDTALAVADRIGFVAGGRIAECHPASDLGPDSEAFHRHVGV
ncbi:amino acid/amide ABC transporter ATP-binding protein 2 (HAAT family) [Albidovulum inexpectatum]|uniref:Amino acid/amide ABC transporter ATP-binding protein 2 (HAAT family) n=1 Tax=Albidovulum inexpectatum TaxID=196587 RepID=A0A2S5JLJ3_9RHOB|nr:ABC transporter ATP-binding protein [Albidovulum inexpectatum]PPB82320.1 amino acid/amide ABC transporter ATP-binding protein 2 (HAAT family) [Albidovulum inexpectatum]